MTVLRQNLLIGGSNLGNVIVVGESVVRVLNVFHNNTVDCLVSLDCLFPVRATRLVTGLPPNCLIMQARLPSVVLMQGPLTRLGLLARMTPAFLLVWARTAPILRGARPRVLLITKNRPGTEWF